jgi:hypothetical protein
MDEQKKFPEQEAPAKNTDNAFVKVNKDGSPQMPGKEKKEGEAERERIQTPPSPRK